MKLARIKREQIHCFLCDWKVPCKDEVLAEKKLVAHLTDIHGRVMLSREEKLVGRVHKEKVIEVFGPTWKEELKL